MPRKLKEIKIELDEHVASFSVFEFALLLAHLVLNSVENGNVITETMISMRTRRVCDEYNVANVDGVIDEVLKNVKSIKPHPCALSFCNLSGEGATTHVMRRVVKRLKNLAGDYTAILMDLGNMMCPEDYEVKNEIDSNLQDEEDMYFSDKIPEDKYIVYSDEEQCDEIASAVHYTVAAIDEYDDVYWDPNDPDK